MKKFSKLSIAFLALLSTGVLLTSCGDKDKDGETTESVTEKTIESSSEELSSGNINAEVIQVEEDKTTVLVRESTVKGVQSGDSILITNSESLDMKDNYEFIDFSLDKGDKMKKVEGGFKVSAKDIKVNEILESESLKEVEEGEHAEVGLKVIENKDNQLLGKVISSGINTFPMDSELIINYTTDDEMGQYVETLTDGETFKIIVNGNIPVTKSLPPQVSLGNVLVTRR